MSSHPATTAFRTVSTAPRRVAAVSRAALAAAFLAITLSMLLSVDIVAQAPARMVASGATRPVTAQVDAVVSELHVVDGERVRRGDRLVTLADPAMVEERARLDARLAALRREKATLAALVANDSATHFEHALAALAANTQAQAGAESFRWREMFAAGSAAHASRLRGYAAQDDALEAASRGYRNGIERAEEMIALYDGKRAAIGRLVRSGSAPELARIDSELERATLRERLAEYSDDLRDNAAARHRLASARDAYLAERAERFSERLVAVGNELRDTRQQLAVLGAQASQLVVSAPIDGTVQELAIDRLNQRAGDTPLLSIVPSGSGLHLVARIRSRDIGFVAPGQSANVVLEAFSAMRFGTLKATVTRVTADVVRGGEAIPVPTAVTDSRRLQADILTTQASLNYVAELTVDVPESAPFTLRPGMAALANIRTGERRVADFFLDPLFRAWHTALTER